MYPAFSLADVLIGKFPLNHPIRKLLESATRYHITNVAEYWYNMPDARAGKDIKLHDIAPNVAPLGNTLWFEWHLTPQSVNLNQTIHAGCLASIIADAHDPEDRALVDKYDAKGRWIVDYMYLWWGSKQGYKFTPFSICYLLNGEGEAMGNMWVPLDAWGAPKLDYEPDEQDLMTVSGYLTPALIATCFAHCKGVQTSEVHARRQQKRAVERAGGQAATYKVLNIDPARKILATEGDVAHNGISKALHIARGHFAHYTQEAPLFGKHAGTFYIPMHVRGSREKGVVVKDYNVLGDRRG